LKAVIDATGLFPSEMLDDMLEPYLADGAVEDIWLVVDDETDAPPPLGLAYCAPERMTSGTWNLYLIACIRRTRERGSVERWPRASRLCWPRAASGSSW
jgi:hypothetical protein